MKKILFDLPEKKLKAEKFDENQQNEFRNSLNNCKYAQLKYNKTDFTSTKVKLNKDYFRKIVFYKYRQTSIIRTHINSDIITYVSF